MLVNQRELSDIVGVSTVTLTEWQKLGMPMIERDQNGLANEYDTEQVIRWMIMRELSKVQNESHRDRLARLQADNIEIDIEVKRGTLVAAADVEPAWLAMVASAKSYLRAEPDRLAQLLEVTDGVDAKRDLLLDTFDDFLRKLSSYDPGEEEEDEPAAQDDAQSGEDLRAAAKDDGRPVG